MGIFRDFVNTHGRIRIVSDGDLDGIFATALLLKYFDESDQTCEYSFPEPRSLRGLVAQDSILIELPMSKGLVYQGRTLLIDHHNNAPHLQYFVNQEVQDAEMLDFEVRAVNQIVFELVRDRIVLDTDAMELFHAVSNIDQGVYNSDLDNDLHHAYLLEIGSPEMRIRVTEWIRQGHWSAIYDWVREGRKKWERVEARANELKHSYRPLSSGVVYFVYSSDEIDRAAMRPAMLSLEEEHPVVIAVQDTDNSVSRISIGSTRTTVDLTPVFEHLRNIPGVTAGGRRSIGGAQFPDGMDITTVKKYLIDALNLARGIFE